MKKCTLLLVTALLFAVSANAAVQPTEKEISIFGTYIHAPLKEGYGSSDGGGLGIGISKFVTDETSVGLQLWNNWLNDGVIADVGVNAKYHFCPTDEITPYIGGQINYAYIANTAWSNHLDGMMWGPLGGLRFNCTDKTSLFIEYQWQLYCGEARSFIEQSSSILVGITCGF
jgi:opacity protein-like surface antigen